MHGGNVLDKKIAGLLGAVATVTTMTGAQAATQSPAAALQASSYADLLMPVPNATAALIADNKVLAQTPAKRSLGVQVADEHHHHHHHVIVIKRHHRHYHHHHHHHHHHSGVFIGTPGAGVVVR
jgi:cobalamin biosynthesis protein CbiG